MICVGLVLRFNLKFDQLLLQDRVDQCVPLGLGKGYLIVGLTDPDRLFVDLDDRTGVAGGAEAHDLFGVHLSHLLF